MGLKHDDLNVVFGCTQEASRAGINRLAEQMFSRFGDDANKALASILSDAQVLLEMGRTDEARQYLNRVKDALYEASPITLWGMEETRTNAEIAHECSESIRVAAHRAGLD